MSGQSSKTIDHIAVAVPSLEEALAFYRDALGLAVLSVEVVEEQGVKVAKLDAGNTHIELLEPLSKDSPVGRFLDKRGPGLHHICMAVEDIQAELAQLADRKTRLIDSEPKAGAGGALIAFVHPSASGGVLMELSQPRVKKNP